MRFTLSKATGAPLNGTERDHTAQLWPVCIYVRKMLASDAVSGFVSMAMSPPQRDSVLAELLKRISELKC